MNEKIKMFTDSDLDGVGCAIIAELFFGENVDVYCSSPKQINNDIKHFIQDGDYKNYDKVFITDLSVSSENANLLNDTFKNSGYVKLIDHHRSARYLNKYSWCTVNEFFGGRKTCGAELFWNYIKEISKFSSVGIDNINIKVADEFIEYVRLYDTWDWVSAGDKGTFSKNMNTIFDLYSISKFIKIIKRRLTNKESENVELIDRFERRLIDIEDNRKREYILRKSKTMRRIEFMNHTVGIVFAENYISELGNCLCKMNEDIDFVLLINTDIKVISLRTVKDDIDLSVIAKENGGGGHPKSAGFVYDEKIDSEIINHILGIGNGVNE